MEKDIAQQLIVDILKCQRAIDAADNTVCRFPDDSEQLWMRRQLAEATGHLTEIVMEIARTHPDLDPLKGRSAG